MTTPNRFSRFGTLPESPLDERDYKVRAYLAKATDTSSLPDEVGSINAEIHKEYLPITDQGQEGSCTGHAMRNTKGVNERRWRSPSKALKVPDFSPRGIYTLGKQVGGYPDEEGAYVRDVAKAAATIGVPREKDWPYVADKSDSGTTQDIGKPSSRWLQYSHPWEIGVYAQATTLEDMLLSLHQIGPLFMAMELHESFYTPGPTGYVSPPTGAVIGGHSMCILMAKQSERRFMFANSWGTGWGASGYGWLDFDHFLTGVPSEAWSIPDLAS